MIKILDYLLLKCNTNTITHIKLETARDMVLHGNYEYSLELLKECLSLKDKFPDEYHKLCSALKNKL
jgi:hypothetical protein